MVANKVEKLLVTNGTTGATVAALTAGQYVALVKGKANNAVLVKGDKFQLAIKKLNTEVQYTDVIKTDDIIAVKVQPYSAPANQVTTITLTEPVAGDTYTVAVIDKSDKEIFQRRQDKRTYSIVASVGETAATLATKFRNSINADESANFTASGTAAALVITGKNDPVDAAGIVGLRHYFEVAVNSVDVLGQINKYGTVVLTTPIKFGSGTFAQVKELEQYTQGYEGYLNRTKFPVELYPSDLSPAATYDLVTIAYDNNYWSNSTVSGKVDSPIEIVIAVPAGATTALEALLAAFITA